MPFDALFAQMSAPDGQSIRKSKTIALSGIHLNYNETFCIQLPVMTLANFLTTLPTSVKLVGKD